MVKTRPGPIDRIMRVAYRLASLLIQLDRRLRESHGRGVKLIITSPEGMILLVRHTYANRHWTLPGGGVRTGEDPKRAAMREAAEELGIHGLPFQSLGTYPERFHRRTEVVAVFTATVDPERVVARSVEISSTVWSSPREVPEGADIKVATALGLMAGHRAEQMAAERNAT